MPVGEKSINMDGIVRVGGIDSCVISIRAVLYSVTGVCTCKFT
jgi:hypothetical protein